ncbi:DinB family protein [Paenibacillus flagellatus]|uniref:DinB family protein n=1 Tax=Paenibacillus flagellatus TaxID=2211139 RepID=A0A2V5KMV4_9BACL|nr:DinB family protein [Paenibacillus flagellatus]PYI56580.1 DinB family protein [Paenibacillus flagellatus]
MDPFLFDQLTFVRGQTLKAMEGVTEELADRIPDGFRNSLRWQLGHVYVVLERFAFQYIGLPLYRPDGFKELFEYGTSPAAWPETVRVPTLAELEVLLREQPGRIREALEHRLKERIEPPYTTSTGVTLAAPEQFISFGLYHEGMHQSVVKLYKTLLNR